MLEVLGGILGGVGLLFFGMWLLSENLKTVVGPRLRILASRLADNRFAAFGWGTLAGAITQSLTCSDLHHDQHVTVGPDIDQAGLFHSLGCSNGCGVDPLYRGH